MKTLEVKLKDGKWYSIGGATKLYTTKNYAPGSLGGSYVFAEDLEGVRLVEDDEPTTTPHQGEE